MFCLLWTHCSDFAVRLYTTSVHYFQSNNFLLLCFDWLFNCSVQHGAMWFGNALVVYTTASVLKRPFLLHVRYLVHWCTHVWLLFGVCVFKARRMHVYKFLDFVAILKSVKKRLFNGHFWLLENVRWNRWLGESIFRVLAFYKVIYMNFGFPLSFQHLAIYEWIYKQQDSLFLDVLLYVFHIVRIVH